MPQKQALGMTMEVSQEFINNIAIDIVKENLMQTLGGSDRFVDQVIRSLLTVKVDPRDGHPTEYRDGIPYTRYLIENIIREETKETVKQVVEENRPAIRAKIREALMAEDMVNRAFDAFTKSVNNALDSYYGMKIDISFPKEED